MKSTLLALLVFFAALQCSAYSVPADSTLLQIVDMHVINNNLYAINKKGELKVWNLWAMQQKFCSSNTMVKYTAIAQDNSQQPYVATSTGEIYKIDTVDFTLKSYITLKKKYYIDKLFFNSQNQPFVIIPNVVYDPVGDKHWDNFKQRTVGLVVKKRFLFFFSKKVDSYFLMPQYSFISSDDKIWMLKSFGEFGGSLQIFDTRARKEINKPIDSLTAAGIVPRSVFEDQDKNIYITSGLQHLGYNSGEIIKVNANKASTVYATHEMFIGPGAYNRADNKIYFATLTGFYKAGISLQGKLDKPVRVFKPELMWASEPHAIGLAMQITKIEFASNNRIVFCTTNNGIGVFDGQKVIMLQ